MAYDKPNSDAANFSFTEPNYLPLPANQADFVFGVEKYRILAGVDNNFVAIWADSNANLTNNKFYISSDSAFSIVDLSDKVLVDYYTASHAGACGEVLDAEDIVDTNVTM